MSYYKVIKGSMSQTQRGQGEVIAKAPVWGMARDAIIADMETGKMTLINKSMTQSDGGFAITALDNYGKRIYYIAMVVKGDIDDSD